MRQTLTILALAGLFGFVVLSNVSRAGCHLHGNACAGQHKKHETPECFKRCFARWDACREKFDLNKCISKACTKLPVIYTSPPCVAPMIVVPQVAPSAQGY